MEGPLIAMLLVWILLFFVVFPIWAFAAIRRIERKADQATSDLKKVESELARLRDTRVSPEPVARPEAAVHGAPQPGPPVVKDVPKPSAVPPSRPSPPLPPPLFGPIPQAPPHPAADVPEAAPPAPPPPPPPARSINWEQFTGVNLFAWIGGFVLFLAAAFFVKYSIDNNLISPQIRVAVGFLLGAALLMTGLKLSGSYRVTSHTLCATAIVILYADIFASHSFYGFIGQPVAFLLMILTTTAAILLAVRLDARLVAVLGLVGGFLTPPLLSAGQDHPLGLFGYTAFLDVGLILVALRKRWSFLVLCAAAGTVLTQIGWAQKFFTVEKVYVALAIFAAFQAIFLTSFLTAARQGLTRSRRLRLPCPSSHSSSYSISCPSRNSAHGPASYSPSP
jgi:uncharacterized membrane protein